MNGSGRPRAVGRDDSPTHGGSARQASRGTSETFLACSQTPRATAEQESHKEAPRPVPKWAPGSPLPGVEVESRHNCGIPVRARGTEPLSNV